MPLTDEYREKLIKNFEKRFRVNPVSGCWEWIYSTKRRGYGATDILGEVVAHRASYRLYISPIPKELFVLHKCDNPSCVNPNHLFLGTQKDNQQDAIRKGRNSRGEINGNANLTEEQVIEIRRLCLLHGGGRYTRGNPYSQKKLAKMFGVWQGTISIIVRRIAWKHLEEIT